MYALRFHAFSDALKTFYTISTPQCFTTTTLTGALSREVALRGAELLKKRTNRMVRALKDTDLAAYSRILDKEKLSKFMTIMRRTDELLGDIGVRFAETVGGKQKGAVTELFASAKGTNAHDQMMAYASNLSRTYELVHKNKVDLAGKQPRLLTGGKLKDFQMTGVAWLISLFRNNINGILADLMGLGKTVQTIALLCHVLEVEKKSGGGPHLVFCPLSLVQQWCEEFGDWAPSVRVRAMEIKDRGGLLKNIASGGYPSLRSVIASRSHQHHHGLRMMEGAVKNGYCDVVIAARNELSYKAGDGARLESVTWGYVIMDEGHAASNAQSKMTTRLRGIPSSHRLLLTGTPMKNRIEELWALLNYINPRIFTDPKEFLDVFNAPLRGAAQDTELSEDERAILILRLHQVIRPFMLRRCPEDIGEVLPTKSTHRIVCPMSALQQKCYALADENLEPYMTREGIPTLRRCFRKVGIQTLITSHPSALEFIDDVIGPDGDPNGAILVRSSGKFLAIDRILRRLRAQGRKAVVFAHRLDIIDLLNRFMAFRGYPAVTLRGDTPREERRAIVEAFQGPDVFVFIASMKSGGQGVDGLQVADVGIFFDLDYTPANDEQAQHRLCRFGQKNHVRILYLTSSSEAENRRLAISEAKRLNISAVIQEGGYAHDDEQNTDHNDEGKEDTEVIEEITCDDAASLDKLIGGGSGSDEERLITIWEDIPPVLQSAFSAARKAYDDEVSGQNLDNYGRGKRVREEYVVEQEIPLHILEKYMDDGMTEQDAQEKWEALQAAKIEMKAEGKKKKAWEPVVAGFPVLMGCILADGNTVEATLKSSGNTKAAVGRCVRKICEGLFDMGVSADPAMRAAVVGMQKMMEQ